MGFIPGLLDIGYKPFRNEYIEIFFTEVVSSCSGNPLK
jgi:hypothetical protein